VSAPSTISAPPSRLFSLRTRLVLLVLIGGLPSLGLTFYTAAEQRKRAAAV